jgi:branched-chain amino acid aminotransferase
MNQSDKFYSVLNDKVITTDDPKITSINPSLVIYEVIRIINGKCLFLEDHLIRLFTSLSLANKKLNLSQNDLIKNIYRLVSANSLINGNIRVEICFQQTKVSLLSQIIPHQYPSSDDYLKGVKAITYKAERDNPNAKILNSVLREKINNHIKNANAWEALLINNQNQITEGSKSNFFAIKGKSVFTPPSTDVLPGITRKHVINLCKETAVNLSERNISYYEIDQFDSFFITGTSPKILPLKMIDDIYFEISGKIIKDLSLAYDNMILQYIEKAEIPVF